MSVATRCQSCGGDISEYEDGATACFWCERALAVVAMAVMVGGTWRIVGNDWEIVRLRPRSSREFPFVHLWARGQLSEDL